MLYILVIWVSNILYLIHKSLKTVLFKFLNLCKLVKYEEKKTVVRSSTATVRPRMLLKRDSNTCAYLLLCRKGNTKRWYWESPYSLHLPFCFLNLVPKFPKGGRRGGRGWTWQDLNLFRGFAGRGRGDFFPGGCNYFYKNKLKSEWIFNDKKKFVKQVDVFLCHN